MKLKLMRFKKWDMKNKINKIRLTRNKNDKIKYLIIQNTLFKNKF